MRLLLIPWILLASLLVACAAPGGASLSTQGDLLLPARLQFVGPGLAPIAGTQVAAANAMPVVRLPDHLWLVLGHTAGRPAGPPAPEPSLRFPLHRERPALERRSFGQFELNLGFIERTLAASAQALRVRPEDDQLAIQPRDARISRLLLGVLDNLQYPLAATTGLREGTDGAQLVLLYADRPCRITGRIDLSHTGTFVDAHATSRAQFAGVFDHEVEIPQPGLHWLRIRQAGPGRFQVTRTDAPAQVSVFVLLSAVAAAGG